MPRIKLKSGQIDFSMVVLLHEYAHHFVSMTSRFAPPRWLSEGGAEFLASANFTKDGVVGIGRPAQQRAYELYRARDVSVEELLDPDTYEKKASGRYDAFYGRSWLLYHYLALGDSRPGQLTAYLRALTSGKSSREAAQEVFGDFAVLEKELDGYLKRKKVKYLKIPGSMLKTGPVYVRELSAGEAAIMPVRIRSKSGVDEELAAKVVVKARAVAAQYPSDAGVLAMLAEAEFDAGYDDAAIAAADRALAIDQRQVNAYVQKGYALFRKAEDANNQVMAYGNARKPFLALNKIENDHPLPLVYYYRSFADRGASPSKTAKLGLERAVELAPFDLGLRMMVARQQIQDGLPDAARRNLAPIAYHPHGGSMADMARAMIDGLDKQPGSAGQR